MEGAAGIEASSLAAVLFDADGVVQHPAVEWGDALASVLDSDADVDRFLRDLFAAEQPTLRGQGDFPSIVAEVLARWGCAGRSAHVLRVFQDIVVDRAVLQVVAELRQAGVWCAWSRTTMLRSRTTRIVFEVPLTPSPRSAKDAASPNPTPAFLPWSAIRFTAYWRRKRV